MKALNILSTTLLAALLMSSPAMAKSKTTKTKSPKVVSTQKIAANSSSAAKNATMADDIDSLGGNRELMQMAENIKSQTRTRIVQDRMVDRNLRLELGLSYGSTFGGDAYLNSSTLGAQIDFHITPRWSIGARYYDYGNKLTSEGKRIFQQAKENYEAGGRAYAVDIDYPETAALAVVNWYPIYGKTSFLDLGVTQFDLYLLAGGGQMTLSSGSTSVLAAGAGVGVWVTPRVSTRLEVRYQAYEDQPVTGARNLDTVVGSLGIGFML